MRILLILFITVAYVTAFPGFPKTKWDPFVFDITVYCNDKTRDTYNLLIEWWEDDTMPGMEQITRPQFYHPKPGNFSFRMEGAMDGDESFSDGHKPVAYITHDCHKKAQQVELVLTVNTLCKTENSCHYRIIQDISGAQGEKNIQADALVVGGNFTSFPDFSLM
ncbi:TransThyretin-Related family domain [Caenorhabditis elegans]|uniref:TransThyretin-Related family domain n=1 Tax=Caenorhabditis elegans TaxID=6239 RepID=Q9U388_CAEEL|nr:TransThyretin-Related family domain [Caenorhabditis elegans]CAB54292.2 TransThyretin-Related family domain [Caenorhabditis elegans]|eukprot:NP_501976.2 Uncharacterized protein CELE_R102.8 [Caenorhabditis elegans]